MTSKEEELVKQLLGALEEEKTIQENLTLLVDTIFMLGGYSCSALLVSRKSSRVWWDYMKGQEFAGGTSAAHEPYWLELEGVRSEPARVATGSYLKLFFPLEEDTVILIRIKKHDDVEMMEHLVDLAEAALPVITEAHARRRGFQAAREASRVKRISDTLLSIPDRSRALQLLATSISKCVASERASVLTLSPNREVLTLKAVYGKVARMGAKSRPIRAGDGVAGWTMANRVAANIADVRRDPRFIVTTCDDITSMLCVPVCDTTGPIGVICAVNKRCQEYDGIKPFLDDDLDFLTNVSGSIAGMLQGA